MSLNCSRFNNITKINIIMIWLTTTQNSIDQVKLDVYPLINS